MSKENQPIEFNDPIGHEDYGERKMGHKKLLLPLSFCAMFCFACAYIVIPADLMATEVASTSLGWSGYITNIENTDAGDLHIDLAIRNDTQDWSAMYVEEGIPALLTTNDGKKIDCDTVMVNTGDHRVAPGFQIRGYTAGPRKEPVTQLLYVECKGSAAPQGATLSIDYTYITGAYDLHIPSIPVKDTMELDLDDVATDLVFPIGTQDLVTMNKVGDKIPAINNFSLILTDVQRTETGLEFFWKDENPSDYPNYVHIGLPPVVGSDGIIYGKYQDPSIADATIALPKGTAEWTTTVLVPNDVTGLYVMVSIETKQSKFFVNHVIDISDK